MIQLYHAPHSKSLSNVRVCLSDFPPSLCVADQLPALRQWLTQGRLLCQTLGSHCSVQSDIGGTRTLSQLRNSGSPPGCLDAAHFGSQVSHWHCLAATQLCKFHWEDSSAWPDLSCRWIWLNPRNSWLGGCCAQGSALSTRSRTVDSEHSGFGFQLASGPQSVASRETTLSTSGWCRCSQICFHCDSN